MKRLGIVLIFFLVGATFTTAAFAQSSGSFSASYGATQCAITANDGTLSPGINGNSLPPVIVSFNTSIAPQLFF
jgi:hypothetical protein